MQRHAKRYLSVLLALALLITMVVIGSVTATGTNRLTSATLTGTTPAVVPLVTFLVPETIWLQTATTQGGTTNTIDRISNTLPGHQVGAEQYAHIQFSSPDLRVQLQSIVAMDLPQPAVDVATGFPGRSMFSYEPQTGGNNHTPAANLHGRNLTMMGGSLAPMGTRVITWTATYTIDGITHTAQAFSVIWAPSTYMAGSVGHVGGAASLNSAVGVIGLHSEILNTGNRQSTTRFFNDLRMGSYTGSGVDWLRNNYLTETAWGDPNASNVIDNFTSGNVVWGHGVRNITNGVHVAHHFTTRIHVGNMVIDERMEGQDIPGFSLTYIKAHRDGGQALELRFGQTGIMNENDRFPGTYGTLNWTGANPNMPGTNRDTVHRIQFRATRLWQHENTPGRPDNGLWTHGSAVPFSVWNWVRAGSPTSETDTNNAAVAHHIQIGVNWVDKQPLRNQVVAASTQIPSGMADPATVTAHRNALRDAVQVLGTPNTLNNSHPAIPAMVQQGTNVTATVQYMIREASGGLRAALPTEVNFTDGRLPGLGSHEARITVPAGSTNNVRIEPVSINNAMLSGIIPLGAGATAPAIPADLTGFHWFNTITGNATYILIYDLVDALPTFDIVLRGDANSPGGGGEDLNRADTDEFISLFDDEYFEIPANHTHTGWVMDVNGATFFVAYDSTITVGEVLAFIAATATSGSTFTFDGVFAPDTAPGQVTIVYRPNGNLVSGDAPANTVSTQNAIIATRTNAWTRAGYRFLGWNRAASPADQTNTITAGGNITLTATENAIIDLFAQWQRLNFELVFAGVPHVNTLGETITVAAPTEPAGQHFIGWACASVAIPSPADVIWRTAPTTMPDLHAVTGLAAETVNSSTVHYRATLVPVFAENVYRVLFLNAYDRAGMNVELLAEHNTVAHNTAFNTLAPATMTQTGYIFRGWSTTRIESASATAPVVDPTAALITADTRFYAVWDYEEFTITWTYGGDVVRTDNNVHMGQVLTPPQVGEIGDEYTAAWWAIATGGAGELIFVGDVLSFRAGAGNATLSAEPVEVEPQVVRVTINPNGGTMASGQTATLTLAAMPGGTVNLEVTQRGRTLTGWALDGDDAGLITSYLIADGDEDLVFVAQWNDPTTAPTTVTPRFFILDDNGDEFELPPVNFAFGEAFGIGFPDGAESGGDQWTFINWIGQDGAIVTASSLVNYETGEEIRAFYVRNYLVEFNPNDGEFVADNTLTTITEWVIYGMTYGEMPEVEREDYVFIGWYDTADETGGTRYQANSRVANLAGGATHQFAGGVWDVPVMQPMSETNNEGADQVLFARWQLIEEFECPYCEEECPICNGECPICEGECPHCGECCEECDCEEIPRGRAWWLTWGGPVIGIVLGLVAVVAVPLLMFFGGRGLGSLFCWVIENC